MKPPQAHYTIFPKEEGQWPSQWLIQIRERETKEGGVETLLGKQVRKEHDGSFTYWCVCGSEINRFPGESNKAVQMWVEMHSLPLVHTTLDADIIPIQPVGD